MFSKDIYILNMAMGFEICFFVAILKYVKVPITVKMCPKSFNTIKNLKIIIVRVSEIYIEFVTSHDNKLNNKINC